MIEESEEVGESALGDGDRVVLSFPARGDLVVLARLVTSAISARAGFDIESLEDLRLAVGELCLLALQGRASRDGKLRLEFTVAEDMVAITCTLTGGVADAATAEGEADVDQLSEQILSALVDEYGRNQTDGCVQAWLRKRRRGYEA